MSPASSSSLIPALQSLSLGSSPFSCSSYPLNKSQRRHAWFGRSKKSSEQIDEKNLPLGKDVASTSDARQKFLDRLSNRGLESESIFSDELSTQPAAPGGDQARGAKPAAPPRSPSGASPLRDHHARATDPDPRSRVRWERKMVIRDARTGTDPFSREPRAIRLARTERQLRSKSSFLPTSVKKLVHLARQIQGKTLADALVQMRYSQKKMAAEVSYQLQLARDQAVAERGMGLGPAAVSDEVVLGEDGADEEATKIRTKDGKWLSISDPTRMYVAEAWVGRGPWRGIKVVRRARGRRNVIRKPSTSKFSFHPFCFTTR